MNKKTTISFIVIVLTLVLLFFAYWFARKNTPLNPISTLPERTNINPPPPVSSQPPTSTSTQTTPPPPPIPPKDDATFIITTSDGDIAVNNFYRTAVEITPDNDAVAVVTSDFRIFYSNSGKMFIITLLSKPISIAKEKAEQAFLKTLNISTESACSLNVSVGTVVWVDPKYSGKELGLSFCKIQSF